MFRAGLVFTFLCTFLLYVVSAAPVLIPSIFENGVTQADLKTAHLPWTAGRDLREVTFQPSLLPSIHHHSKQPANPTDELNTLYPRNAFVHAFQHLAHGIKRAAEHVAHFARTTGAKIAKFGMKLVATAQTVGARIASFLPRGEMISKALKNSAAVLNTASNAIHVSLGRRLNKGLSAMEGIQHPLETATGAVGKKIMQKRHK